MELLTAIVRIALIVIVVSASLGAILYGLMKLSEAVDRDIADLDLDPYDWAAEGDFPPAPAAPAYLAESHNPLLTITDDAVTARCSCDQWIVSTPIRTTQQAAYDRALELFWAGHMDSLRSAS